jgi:hypothetical protein
MELNTGSQIPTADKITKAESSQAESRMQNLLWTGRGLVNKHTSHGLRAGSVDDMVMDMCCHVVCMIKRGG